jgi:nucleoside-diphosphate-sugar epimerase/protoporphyrinogen oxidase
VRFTTAVIGLVAVALLSGALLLLGEEWLAQSERRALEAKYAPSIAIVGAGVTGLCAARRLEELGYGDNYVLVDEASEAGGLARSFVDERGFAWDLGVHVLFSHYEFFDRLLDEAIGEKLWLQHVRRSPAFMRGAFVGYPVQDNLAGFPRDEALRIIADLNATRADRRRCNELTGHVTFDRWMHFCFGDALTAAFGRPYNYKVWAYPAERMNSLWVGERVATIDVDDVVRRFEKNEQRTGWGPNAIFRYPVNGTGAIWDAVFQSLPRERFRLNTSVVGVNLRRHQLTLSDGTLLHYDKLISTMPMDRLAGLARRELPSALRATLADRNASFLRQTCNLRGFGLKCAMPAALDGVHWIYFPEEEFPFYRATVLSNLSPAMVPDFAAGQWSILVESSESPMRALAHENHTELVLAALRRAKLLPADCELLSTWSKRLEYGYPVPYDVRDTHVHAFDAFLLEHSVHSRGRFGVWKYEVANQDHSCAQGVEAVDRILFGAAELTMRKPNHVNNLYTAHQAPLRSQLFSPETFPLRLLAKWTVVVANCDDAALDAALEALVRDVIPDDVRFQIIVYEMCAAPPKTLSVRDRRLHVVRLAAPHHATTDDVVFAHHIRSTYTDAPPIKTSAARAQHSDWTLFVPAAALRRRSVWLRCGELLNMLQQRAPDFGVIADVPVQIPVVVTREACQAIADARQQSTCGDDQLPSCMAPGQAFFASRQRLATARMPLLAGSGAPALRARDWQVLWPALLGGRAGADESTCIPANPALPGEYTDEASGTECPSVAVVARLLNQVVQQLNDTRDTLVVTGALGNIGLTLLRRLLAVPYAAPQLLADGGDAFTAVKSWKIVAIDNRNGTDVPVDLRPHVASRRLVVKRIDITDRAKLHREFQSSDVANVRGVIHLAAVSRVADCQRDTTRCLAVNTRGTEHVASVLRDVFLNHATAPWLLFTSSREVFGDTKTDVVDEQSVQNPHNVYGASKAFAETYVRQHVEHGYRAMVLRLSNVYGSWEDNEQRVVPNFVCRAVAGEPLLIVGGTQMMNLIHIDDIERGIELAMHAIDRALPGEQINVAHLAADTPPVPIKELAAIVTRIANSSSPIQVTPSDSISVDNYNTRVDAAQTLLNWHATVSVADGIGKFVRSYPFGKTKCPVLRDNGAGVQVFVPVPTPAAAKPAAAKPAPAKVIANSTQAATSRAPNVTSAAVPKTATTKV